MSAITAGVTAKSVKDKEPTGGTDPGASAAGENSPGSTGADPQV